MKTRIAVLILLAIGVLSTSFVAHWQAVQPFDSNTWADDTHYEPPIPYKSWHDQTEGQGEITDYVLRVQ